MTSGKPTRKQVVLAKLKEGRDSGTLGVVAASSGVAEYKLHDAARDRGTLPEADIRKLYDYFKGKE